MIRDFIEEYIIKTIAVVVIVGFLLGLLLSVLSLKWNPAQEVVSGIAYNTKNDKFLSGNTSFSIRADVDTYVSEENKSSFCLPPNSQYKELVNQAALDKNIKLKVTANKFSPRFAKPWTCIDNVVVERINQ